MSRHSEALEGLLTSPPFPCIAAAAAEHDASVLCVGGAVRDALLSRSAADVDIAVAGDLDAFVGHFERHCGRKPVAIGDPWRRTRRTMLGDVQVDLGAMLGDEMDDLGGRDFTINAMAVRLGGRAREPGRETVKLLDPHHGVADLEQQRIRMTSAAALRADPLRMLRAVRYFAVLEGFHIESATLAAIVAGAADIEVAADERVQAEWARLLAAPRWAAATRLAFDVGLGERTLGFAVRLDAVDAWSRRERERGARLPVEELTMLRLAAIIAGTERATIDAAAPALVRRRWPRRLAQPAARIAAWAVGVGEASDTIAWALDDRDCAARAALLAQALVDPEDARLSARIEELALHAERAAEEPWVTGADLRSWGLEEGPRLGALLQEAARGQLERRWDSAAEARSWARRRAGATPAERTG